MHTYTAREMVDFIPGDFARRQSPSTPLVSLFGLRLEVSVGNAVQTGIAPRQPCLTFGGSERG